MSDEKTFTQDDVNEIVRERLARQAAKFSDYEDLKARVQQYEAASATSQTEMDALKSQVAELTAKSAKTEREALVARVARDNGITDSDDIELFLTGADEQQLTAQAARLASRTAAATEAAAEAAAEAGRANAIVPTEGQNLHTPQALDSDQEFAAAIAAALGQAQGLAE